MLLNQNSSFSVDRVVVFVMFAIMAMNAVDS